MTGWQRHSEANNAGSTIVFSAVHLSLISVAGQLHVPANGWLCDLLPVSCAVCGRAGTAAFL